MSYLTPTPSSLSTGSIISISNDTSTASATVPNTDTNVKTYALAANAYSTIIAEADVEIDCGVLTTIQDITVKVKIGVSSKDYIFTGVGVAQKRTFGVRLTAAQKAAATVAISHGAAAADANTTVIIQNLYVRGIV